MNSRISTILALSSLSCLLLPAAFAADVTWTPANTTFSNHANWTRGGVPGGPAPGNSDIALFNGPGSFQPTLNADRSIAGIRFAGPASGVVLGSTGIIPPILTLGGSGIVNQSLAGTNTVSARLSLGAATSFTNSLSLAITGALNLNGNSLELSGTGAAGSITGPISGTTNPLKQIEKTGTGTWLLSGNNSYTGSTSLRDGTVAVGHNNALGSSLLGLNGGALEASGGPRTLANTVLLSEATFGGTELLTLSGGVSVHAHSSINVRNGSIARLTGVVDELVGAGALRKDGAGELQLTNANAYIGGTQIDEGTLRINNTSGSALGSGTVTVGVDGMLTGAGKFTGALQLNGTLSAGNSPGTLSTGSQTWAGGADLIWEINDFLGSTGGNPGWDHVSIIGGLNLAATALDPFTIHLNSLALSNLAGQAAHFDSALDYSFNLVHTTLGITNFNAAAFALDVSGFQNAFDGSWSVARSGNDLVLHYDALDVVVPVNPVPDRMPHVALIACLGLIAAHWQRSRRIAAAHMSPR